MRPVMPMNTRTVWPWLVIRSMSRSAWVIQISAGQADQHQQERTKRGAKDIAADRPHPPASSPFGRTTQTSPGPIPRRPLAKGGPHSPRIHHDSVCLDPSTKWLLQRQTR